MKNTLKLLSLLLVSALLFACKTDDIKPDNDQPNEADLFEIPDLAFADYLIYNSQLAPTEANKLPAGIVVEKGGVKKLDKTLAATVTNLNLVKSSSRMNTLEGAGVPTARVKIVNLDGIQFFTNLEKITMTSNDVVGKLDLSMLTKLDTLEMNSNFVNELIVPATVTRLRFAAGGSATDEQKLTAIDLSANSNLEHLHLPNHLITTEGLILPNDCSKLKEVDLSGNPGAPFTIPEELFNQLTTANGVVADIPATFYQLKDQALIDYLLHNMQLAPSHDNKLPEGLVVEQDGKMLLDKTLASSVTRLYLLKDKTRISDLEKAGVPTAADKIVNLDCIEFFTNCEDLRIGSNDITGTLDVSMLTKLTRLDMNSNLVNKLIVPANVVRLRYSASGSATNDQKLTEIDVSANSNLENFSVPDHLITKAGLKLPTDYSKLTHLNLSGNPDAPFTIPAALFNQLDNKSDGVVSE